MMATEKDVFTFDELSDDAKETAREGMRDAEQQDFEPCYESFETAATILGIELTMTGRREPDIRWSGFSSQGDGASFVGFYSHAPNSPAKIRAEFGTDTALHEISDGLNALQCGYRLLTGHWINAKVEQSGNYHKNTMSVTIEDAETGDEVDVEIEDKILDLMRNFAQWIYKSLEAEYDYIQTEAMARSKGICEICKTSKADQVHHILPIRYFLDSEDAHYINNTLAVCAPCHNEEHRQMKHRYPIFNHLKLKLCRPGRVKLCAPSLLGDKSL